MFIAVSVVTLHWVIGLGEIIYVKHLGCDRHSVSMKKMTAISSKASQCNQPILGRRELRHEKLSKRRAQNLTSVSRERLLNTL